MKLLYGRELCAGEHIDLPAKKKRLTAPALAQERLLTERDRRNRERRLLKYPYGAELPISVQQLQ
jgi:hypothetical protein